MKQLKKLWVIVIILISNYNFLFSENPGLVIGSPVEFENIEMKSNKNLKEILIGVAKTEEINESDWYGTDVLVHAGVIEGSNYFHRRSVKRCLFL